MSPHEPPAQTDGATQSASAVHVALQAATPHWKGAHDAERGVTQVPAPSHEEAGVKVAEPAGHFAAPHGVPAANRWQAPASHMPFVPHVAAA